jgi:hypothetical protein
MAGLAEGEAVNKGVINVVKELWRNDGFGGFYRG